jgi:hypothetical protein
MNVSRASLKVLKLFYRKYSLSSEEISKIPDELLSSLEKSGYVVIDFLGYPDGRTAKYSDYHITDSGKAYVQSHSSLEWFKQNWIALFSLIFAFIGALPVIWHVIQCILMRM